MHLSLIFGFAMLIGKTAAYFMTQSAADFSEAAESVIHVIAVGFATISSFEPSRVASSLCFQQKRQAACLCTVNVSIEPRTSGSKPSKPEAFKSCSISARSNT